MFWRFGGYASISTLDTILDKPDVTLEELLDEADLIQELKQHNSKLIEYLRDENVLKRLLEYVIAPNPHKADDEGGGIYDDDLPTEPGESGGSKGKGRTSQLSEEEIEKEDKARLKYAYVACEILSSDVWSILEALLENRQHLRQFWEYLRQGPSLDPLQAGYFTKVNEMLLDKKTEEMLDFFKTLDWVIPVMLKHVDCPMVMDLLLKIISLEKAEGGQGIVDWLHSQNLIPILLSYLSPERPAPTQTSAGDFLKAIITISANASQNEQSCIGPNDLTRQLVSEKCITDLITDMLRGGNPLTVGVGIIIEVIRKNNSDYDPEVGAGANEPPSSRDPIYLGTLLRIFAQHVPDFMELILSPNYTVVNGDGTKIVKRRELKAAFGENIEPLGFDRFKTCELMAELLHCSNMGLLNERGSARYVKERDTIRERLKAEGNLPVTRERSNTDNTEDSSSYQNGEAPSLLGSSPDEIRKLEVQNGGEEDGFEDVAASGVLNDDVKDDFDEKLDTEIDMKEAEPHSTLHDEDDLVDEPLSSPLVEARVSDKSTKRMSDPRPLSLTPGATEKVSKLQLDLEGETTSNAAQTLASEQEGQSVLDATEPLNPAILSPHNEDRPAPLFSKRSSAEQPTGTQGGENPTGGDSQDTIDTTQGEEGDSIRSVISSGNDNNFEPHFETDVDGSPVVGDYLKMMFVEHRVVPTILDFFFRFPWNNFLHNVVYDVVQQVFNGPMERGYNRTLAVDLFETGHITERIVEGQRRSDKAQEENNMRLGYMGHLTLIAEEVVKFTERHPPELLSRSVLGRVMDSDWVDYVEHTLAETRERDNAILGGVRPDLSVGNRQAVINAVNAAQGFGGQSQALVNAGLTGGAVSSLDSIDLANGSATSGGTFSLSGGSLLSGFGSSSDEDDEEMEEADEEERSAGISQDNFPADSQSQQPSLSPPSAPPPPPPLNIPPSRARRQLAARLALHQRQAADAAAHEAEGNIISSSPPEASSHETDGLAINAEPRTGHTVTGAATIPGQDHEEEDDWEDEDLSDNEDLFMSRGPRRGRHGFSGDLDDDPEDATGDSNSPEDEDGARARRRLSGTTEARVRTTLEGSDEEEDEQPAHEAKHDELAEQDKGL